jgi:5-methylcytosine-specific restriction endonuclease McrA
MSEWGRANRSYRTMLAKARRERPGARSKIALTARIRRLRNPLTERLHESVADYALVLDGDPCAYCNGPSVAFDHIDPRSPRDSHTWDWDNLTATCRSCNSLKGRLPLLHGLLGF